ncbi:MAG: amino acid/polyamine/organocation transporter, superfamily [Marmoricola sp.]|nr:amino acid/polyamine/organocation transporter, superfamily [Marmoricola sp.]
MSDTSHLSEDEQELARLGYSQELDRSWSGFSNFAISFSIISILAGCFTTFYQAWQNGGPVAISWGWPIVSALILVIGFTMSELVSAYPTSGGIYWWASKMGGPAAGFFTGWLNLIGLLAVTASVAYGAAGFLDLTLGTVFSGWADGASLPRTYVIFLVLMLLAVGANVFGGHLLAVINNISVWWHVAGAAVVILILVLIPDTHQSLHWVFTERINNSGFDSGATSDFKYWFLVMPLGLLLTQYTITGYDASAHLSEETASASKAAAKGIWRSIAYSAIGGYVLLLAFLFAVKDPKGVSAAGGAVDAIFGQSLPTGWHFLVLLIATGGQLFCLTACMTSCSRMTFAFSRDGAIPGSRMFAKVSPKTRVPVNAVLLCFVVGVVITLPALYGVAGVPVAFLAVVSIAVIGLYLAFAVPIFLRWRMGDAFEPGSWTLGRKYRWMNPLAVIEIAVVSIYFILPFSPAGVPGSKDFAWASVNYAPILTFGTLILLAVWWNVSAKKWFTGPKHTFDSDVVGAFDD